MAKQEFFVAEALRFGDRECHSYVIGIFTTESKAKEAGEYEKYYRGGKYDFTISTFKVDSYFNGETNTKGLPQP